MKQWFYYSLLRACKLYTDDHCQTAKKNVLPFIRNSELCICCKILFWPAIFQRFLPSSALDPVLCASHIAQELTGSFPRPSFLPPWRKQTANLPTDMKTPLNFCGFMQMSKSPGETDGSIRVKIVIPFCFSVKQPANLICSQECLRKIKNSSVPMNRSTY